ncbi:hypothetical protein [uncultured Pelagimonas sp.]|uniref:hypothetical protein n=1 Tax=uncultured Pelagimonas sp. TaxID=1618102 RepID=UPI0026397E55|nr:hypothetical protein [uncultured Pelagimonas sp.]
MHRIIISLALALVVAGCGNPLKDVPKLSDVEVDTSAGQADALAAPIDAALDEALVDQAPVAVTPTEKPSKGLMGFLKRKADEAKGVPVIGDTPEDIAGEVLVAEPDADAVLVVENADGSDGAAPLVLAALPEPEIEATPKPKKKGLFGLSGGSGDSARKPKRSKGPKPGDPDYEQVALGTSLPYGKIARVCGANPSQMGKKAGQWPERGRGYTLYDSAPGATGQRSFYITGFDDGCARVFSAALVLFASPESYEAIHYGPAGATLPTSATDVAYEKVKSRVCRVGKGKPCGSKMKKLSKDTVFVTVYERFGGSPRWKNFLLHDGRVEAMDIKS